MSRFVDIPCGNALYCVGDDGSFWKWMPKRRKYRRIKGSPHKAGHIIVTMTPPGERSKRYYLHRIVLEAFTGPCPAGMEACHEDDNPANNHVSNLRWGTRLSNIADRIKHGKHNRGVRNGQSKLDENMVRHIRDLSQQGMSDAEISRQLGMNRECVTYACRHGWKHIV